MKKNAFFMIPMIAAVVLLFLLRATGMATHIAVSAVGLAILAAYAVATKKEWKAPVLEISMRVFYAIALITGVVLMNVHGIIAVAVAHKISAVLFAILFVVTEIHKAIKK